MFDGGGFDPSGGYGSQANFASPADKTKAVRRQDNVFPLCIKQILEAPEDGLKFGNVGVHMAELVAIVRRITIENTNVQYLLDDNTGGLTAVYWTERVDNPQEQMSLPNVVENAYYRVYGTIRTLQGRRFIQTVRIIPIKDLNELTTHILEVIHKPLLLEKLSCMESVKAPMASTSDTGLSNSFMSSTTSSSGFNPLQQKVYNVIMRNQQDIGIQKSEIVKQLEGQMSLRDILQNIEFLSTEGHIYSTIDEEHYRCTDN